MFGGGRTYGEIKITGAALVMSKRANITMSAGALPFTDIPGSWTDPRLRYGGIVRSKSATQTLHVKWDCCKSITRQIFDLGIEQAFGDAQVFFNPCAWF